jgi:hypothetical protein
MAIQTRIQWGATGHGLPLWAWPLFSICGFCKWSDEALLIVDANFFPDIQQLVASLPFTSCECECSPTISETYLRNTMQESRLKGELARKYKLILKNSLCFEKSPDTFHAGDVA